MIVGAGVHRTESDIASSFGDFVLVFRELMNRLNDFLPTALPPTPHQDDYVHQIVDSVASCQRVDVLLLGAFTSFLNYGPAIRSKIGRVVISGRPLTGDGDLEAVESFNCTYDRPSCATVFHEQLPGLDHSFVDVPRSECDLTPNRAGCVGTVYGPTLDMARAGADGSAEHPEADHAQPPELLGHRQLGELRIRRSVAVLGPVCCARIACTGIVPRCRHAPGNDVVHGGLPAHMGGVHQSCRAVCLVVCQKTPGQSVGRSCP